MHAAPKFEGRPRGFSGEDGDLCRLRGANTGRATVASRGSAGFSTLGLRWIAGEATNSGAVQGKKVFTSEVLSCVNLPDTQEEVRLCYPDLVFVPDPAGAVALLRMIIGRMQCVLSSIAASRGQGHAERGRPCGREMAQGGICCWWWADTALWPESTADNSAGDGLADRRGIVCPLSGHREVERARGLSGMTGCCRCGCRLRCAVT